MALKDIEVTAVSMENDVNTVVSDAKSKILAILGGAQSKLSAGLFAGDNDFTGININGLNTLQQSIRNYCNKVQAIVNNYKEDAEISGAFKGDVAEAVQEFVKEVKKLLTAYVSNIRRDSEEAGVIFAKYKGYTGEAKSDMTTNGVSEIRNNANSIKFEEKVTGPTPTPASPNPNSTGYN
jgi:hypothetical protein